MDNSEEVQSTTPFQNVDTNAQQSTKPIGDASKKIGKDWKDKREFTGDFKDHKMSSF